MGGLIEPSLEPSPLAGSERESNLRPILLGVVFVLIVVAVVALLLRSTPRAAAVPHPYAANLKLSDSWCPASG